MGKRKGPVASIIMKRLGGNRLQVNEVDPSLPEKNRRERSVAVIGGGIAGLVAAAVLSERGLKVSLYENNDYLGGKIGSWPVRFKDGFNTQVEHGFHAFFRQYYNLRRFLDRIGSGDYLIPIEDYLISTLDHGDYAAIDAIPGKERLAQTLNRRSLDYHPNARAYLGLGIQFQTSGRHSDAVRLLSEAAARFPDHEPLHLCLAVSHMNTGRFSQAMRCLEKFSDSPQVLGYLAECHRQLGNTVAAAEIERRLKAVG